MHKTTKLFIGVFLFNYGSLSASMDFDKAVEKSRSESTGKIIISGDENKAATLAQSSIDQFRNHDDEKYTVQKRPAEVIETRITPLGSYEYTINCGFTYLKIINVIGSSETGVYFSGGGSYSSLAEAINHNCSK